MTQKIGRETRTEIIAIPAEKSLRDLRYTLGAKLNAIRQNAKEGDWMPKKISQLEREKLTELYKDIAAQIKKRCV